jgi:hypothetical protein
MTLMPFGKYEGQSYTTFSKRTIRAYLETYQWGAYTFFHHRDLYCEMHKYATEKWPSWSKSLCLICDCNRPTYSDTDDDWDGVTAPEEPEFAAAPKDLPPGEQTQKPQKRRSVGSDKKGKKAK